jgi:DNA mismatch repair protein MSH4
LPHKVAPGPVRSQEYGLNLARRFLSTRVVDNAEDMANFLRDSKSGTASGPATCAARQNKLITALPDLLKQSADSSMDPSALTSYNKRLQTEFTVRMSIVDDANNENGEIGPRRTEGQTTIPVIARPQMEELALWDNKNQFAEERIITNNISTSQADKKRSLSNDDNHSHSHKRAKSIVSDVGTEFTTSASQTPHATPVNRGLLIEELRQNAAGPTTSSWQTRSSLQSGPYDTSSSTLDPTSPIMTVTSSQSDTEMNIEGNEELMPDQSGSAMTISSDSTLTSMNEMDQEMADAEYPEGDAEIEEEQPLSQFQPLRDWYARIEAEQSTSDDMMEED